MRINFPSLVSSLNILDGTIVNVDVNAGAAIAYSKLLSIAIDADLIPDVNVSRSLGSGAKNWLNLYVSKMDVTAFYNSVDPDVNGTQVIGTNAKCWKEIWVNAIYGEAADFIAGMALSGGGQL